MNCRTTVRATILAALIFTPLFAQPRAIVTDGAGPWRDAQWGFAVSQMSALLTDAGYSVTTVSPADLASAIDSPNVLVAVPSLESLPFECFQAIVAHVNAGGTLMATGGEPFRSPLYRTPDRRFLDAAAYQQAVGSPPPQGPLPFINIPTLAPADREQYVAASGVRVPVTRNRGLFASAGFFTTSRYRVIGDLLLPAATLYDNSYFSFSRDGAPSSAHGLIVWLPWPQLFDPLRAQLIAALRAAPRRLYLDGAGADHMVWLPGEVITGKAIVLNGADTPIDATLQWSVSGPSGATAQPAQTMTLGPGELRQVPLLLQNLPNGDYTLRFHLTAGAQETDHFESPIRVLNPILTRQPDQKIRIVDGAFFAGDKHIFLRGVNYWPRFISGVPAGEFNGQSWLESIQYDPDLIEADLTEIAGLGFNLLNIQFSDLEALWDEEGRNLIDFLERCRTHGIWVQISLRSTVTNAAYDGQITSTLEKYLRAAYLPGNDRVFAYELLWEPMIGTHDKGGQGRLVNGQLVYNTGRLVLDPDWRSWVNDQYGSLANAEQAWGFTAPRDDTGQLTNPLDQQIQNDGPWRVMVAAYRRFLDDYIGRNLGAIARQIRRTDPDTLLTYRNWVTMTDVHNTSTGYDIGAGAAHLDFVSPEHYAPVLLWPDARAYGLISAYSRYRAGGKPVVWAEYGADIGGKGGNSASRAAQAAVCDAMMRVLADGGANGASVWWWPGGFGPLDGTDFGIIDPDGTPRACARTLAQWNATFGATPPDVASDPPATLTVDRDSDARGSYGLFLNNQDAYVQTRQSGRSVVLADRGTGTDTATMPLIQVGNVAYSGTGPLKYANAEIGGIRVICPNVDATVENGSTLTLPSGTACQITPTLVNSGEAQWLAGVTLHTSAGDVALAASLAPLQRTTMGPLDFTMGQSATTLTGRMKIAGAGDFGEVLKLNFVTAACTIAVSPVKIASVPAGGATGTFTINAPAGCAWDVFYDQPWITLIEDIGTVTYTIAANSGPKRQATIAIANNRFTLTQDGAASAAPSAKASLSPATLSFGNAALGTSTAAQSVQLTNSGSGALNLLSISPGGLNSGDFSTTNNCPPTIATGSRCTIQVTFAPTAAGVRTASLFVVGNLSGAPPAVTLSGAGTATGPAPAIQAIVDSWGYSAGVAPGLWVTIAGTNLGGAPQTWNLDGVQNLPTSLGGTKVTFNGSPAALLYVSPMQINALVPAAVQAGPVQVIVQSNGISSAPFNITAKAAQPAVYAPPIADGSAFYVTAALAGTATLIGNNATDPRVARAAYPGDTLDLYMIGLGATTDSSKFITDQVFSGAFPVSAPVTATVGGKSANVLFAGLTAPGLYLVRIVLPSDVAAGAQPLKVSMGGIDTRTSLLLQVASPPN
jgi:uncharacterized protein (TIGR03437 family)